MKGKTKALLLLSLSLAFFVLGGTHAQQIPGNFTVSSSYYMTSGLNYSGWIFINGGSLTTGNYSIQANGIVISNGSSLDVGNGSTITADYLYNNGSVSYSSGPLSVPFLYNYGSLSYVPNSLNVSFLFNYGNISHENWFRYYKYLPFSYGGSGGGGGTNYGEGATQGYSTRVSGGGIGGNPAGSGSEAPPIGNVSYPIFNQSILSGAAGGNSSCDAGSFGAYGFIISTYDFANYGKVSNNGQGAPGACYDYYNGGGGGAGGGGVLEILFSGNYTDNGTYDTSGGSISSEFNGPWTYGGFGGAGGAGQSIVVRTSQQYPWNGTSMNSTLPINENNTVNNTMNVSNSTSNQSVSNTSDANIDDNYTAAGQLNLTALNRTITNLTAQINEYRSEISGLNGAYSSLDSEIAGLYYMESQSYRAVYNYSQFFGKLLNDTGSIVSLIEQENATKKPLVQEAPMLSVVNASGMSVTEALASGMNQSYFLELYKPGLYNVACSNGNSEINLELGVRNQTSGIKNSASVPLSSFLISTMFFLPGIVYSFIV